MPTVAVPEALALALQHHHAGRLADAEALYRQILDAQPSHPEALHRLGIVAHQAGRHDLAVQWIRQSLVIDPNNAIAHCNLGGACRVLGQLDEAIASFRRAVQLKPDLSEAHSNLGDALKEQGRLEEAASAFRRALQIRPGYPDALNHLGETLTRQGQLDEAVAVCQRALEIRPDYPEALNNLGLAFVKRGELDAAMTSYRRALRLQPGYAKAHNNLGIALAAQGHLDHAVTSYQRALALRPDFAEAHSNLGIALADQGQLDDAVAAFRRALHIRPDFPATCINLGKALKDQGLVEESLAACRRAMKLRPENPLALSNLIYALHFQPGLDERTIAGEQHRWSQQFAEPRKQFVLPHRNGRTPGRRLRVGYVSPDFRDQVVGLNLVPLFEHHDRAQFEILCYSGVANPDSVTGLLRRKTDLWRNIVGLDDEAVAEMIRRDGVDILVDLTQHMSGHQLLVFARQPAPVQVSFACYPESTGLEAIGYRMSDRYLESEMGDGRWTPNSDLRTEQILLLESFWCYEPCGIEVEVNGLPALKSGRVTFGCLNNFCKINEPLLRLWSRMLLQVKDSRLVILSAEGSHRQRTREIFMREGITVDRVEFVAPHPRRAYLELYHRLDIALDPFPYNGHTTSLDALWMGVPVVSLVGQRAVSRAGLSQLSNLGLADLAAFSEDDYIRIAAQLTADLPRLAELRKTLRPRMEASTLMDAPRFARQIETAYHTMWQHW